MPSPGISTLKSDLAFSYTVEGGFSTQIILDSETDVRLATGINNGWGSPYPTTPTTMEIAILAAFGGYVLPTGGGYQNLRAIGLGIDEEIAAWIASWDSIGMVHTYTVNPASIESRIISHYTINSNATAALALNVAQTFCNYFIQEGG